MAMKLTDFEGKMVAHILRSSPPGKHAARSALRHLDRASQLIETMPELAIFSGITAEEEAATAVFHAIKRKRYKGARLLKTRNHVHKSALHPFFLAVGRLLVDFSKDKDPKLVFNESLSGKKKELLRIRLTVKRSDGGFVWAYPYPPLDFIVEVNDGLHDFRPELSQFASEKNAKSALDYIKKLANRRNTVLYAAHHGIPRVDKNPQQFLVYRKSVVFSHLIAFLLIDPYPGRQLFVQQALDSFLDLHTRIPERSVET